MRPLTEEETRWLLGYCVGTRIVLWTRRTFGWARGKGHVRKQIKGIVHLNAYGAGVLDAWLDSVN